MLHTYWAPAAQLLRPAHLRPVLRNKRSSLEEARALRQSGSHSPQLEKPRVVQWRPGAAKNKTKPKQIESRDLKFFFLAAESFKQKSFLFFLK